MVTNILASLGGGYISCTPALVNQSLALVVPPGGSAAVSVANFTCTVDVRRYIYRDGGPASPIYVNVSAAYRGLVLVKKNAAVASIVARPAGRGYFNYTGGACVIGPVGALKPLYYVLLSGSNVLAYGVSPQQLGDGAVVQCPPGRGYYTYRLVLSNGTVLSVPVAVDRLYVWAEANRTSAYVNQTARAAAFDLYLRFTNPAAGYAPVTYTYSLVYNTALLSCTMVAKPQYVTCTGGTCTGNTALAPTETRALYVGTYRCNATDAFFKVNATTVAVSVSASYGGYVYFNGVVGRPSYSAPANWVVLRIEAGRAAYASGASAISFEQRQGLVSLIYARPPAPPPPTCPMFYLAANSSLYPLVSTSGLNLYKWVMPSWREDYVVGTLSGYSSASLAKVSQSQNPPRYEIYLGPNLQLNLTQSSGPSTALPAAVRWVTAAGASYWVYANATAVVGGRTCAQPIANFTAKPMRSMASWTFSCPTSSKTDDYATYNTQVRCNTWNFTNLFPYSRTVTNSTSYTVAIDTKQRVSSPSSLYMSLGRDNTYLVYYMDISRWLGVVYATASFSVWIRPDKRPDASHTYQVSFFIDTNGDGIPDLEKIYYSRGSKAVPVGSYLGFFTSTLIGGTVNLKSGKWRQFSLSQIHATGRLVGVAFVLYGKGDTAAWWDDMTICPTYYFSNAPYIQVVADGWTSTSVYIDTQQSPSTPPSLVTEVDAFDNTGDYTNDYGTAAAVYNVTKWLGSATPAFNTTISVKWKYVKDSGDVSNNVWYVSAGVDIDGDGAVDREYIWYWYDGGSGIITSMYFTDAGGNPVVVCQLSGGSCTPTDSRFVVQNMGPYSSGATSSFSYTLTAPGALLYLALVAVDASGYADGTADDFWVYWDDLSIQYSACPPPSGWSSTGYVWQSYNYLLVTGGTAYFPTLSNALTYVANFTGVGKYVALTTALAEAFGVYWRGSTSGCVYGLSPPPAARWVELRPLSGLGDVIIRDSAGGILARYGCQNPPATAYIGFKTAPGEILKVYSLEVWGMG